MAGLENFHHHLKTQNELVSWSWLLLLWYNLFPLCDQFVCFFWEIRYSFHLMNVFFQKNPGFPLTLLFIMWLAFQIELALKNNQGLNGIKIAKRLFSYIFAFFFSLFVFSFIQHIPHFIFHRLYYPHSQNAWFFLSLLICLYCCPGVYSIVHANWTRNKWIVLYV